MLDNVEIGADIIQQIDKIEEQLCAVLEKLIDQSIDDGGLTAL